MENPSFGVSMGEANDPRRDGAQPSPARRDGLEAKAFAPLRVVIVTNIPAPYRMPVYSLLAQYSEIDLHVVYCSGREPDREWNLSSWSFQHSYLNERFVTYNGRFIHFNHDIWSELDRLRPDVLVTTGFNPTHLIAYGWARVHGIRHVAMTDGTLESEETLTPLHRWIRRRVYDRTSSFIGASEGSMRLYRDYAIEKEKMFKSHLCADNELFFNAVPQKKSFDFIFCGRFVAVKNPLFALQVSAGVAQRLGRQISIVFVGSGPLNEEIQRAAKLLEPHVITTFAGFAKQEELPRWYGAARLFLFPTQWDPWGVVANEACAAGVPVMVSPVAGCVGDLVIHGENGRVLPLQQGLWIETAAELLQDDVEYQRLSRNCRERVREFSYANAARGIVAAALAADRAHPPWSSRRSITRPKVVVIQRRLTHYRVPLFELMREKLHSEGVELQVVYGDPTREETLKDDSGVLPWGIHVPCAYWLNGRLCWQNAMHVVRDADLVVITQENRLLFNYLFGIIRGGRKWAFWGHGRNFQSSDPDSLRERFKRWLARHVDWWFTYTALSTRSVVDSGFPEERITELNNTIDISSLARDLRLVDGIGKAEVRNRFGLGQGPVALSLASLHDDKRFDILLEACDLIRQKIPDFQLLIVGDGPRRDVVQKAANLGGGWIRWAGALSGMDKAYALRAADIMVNPGMVGLSIVDSFVAALPMVTTSHKRHSPEISYLKTGINGLITDPDPQAFAAGVVELLSDRNRLVRLAAGAREAADGLSIEAMAERFCRGIHYCLARDAA